MGQRKLFAARTLEKAFAVGGYQMYRFFQTVRFLFTAGRTEVVRIDQS